MDFKKYIKCFPLSKGEFFEDLKTEGKEMGLWVEENVEDRQDSCLITHVSLGDDVQAGFAHALGH